MTDIHPTGTAAAPSTRRQFPLVHIPVAFGIATTWGEMRAMVEHATAYADDDLVDVTWMWNDPQQIDAIVIRADGRLED